MDQLLGELVVGVDGSDASKIAFAWACAQAGPDGHVTAVHSVPALSQHFAEIPESSNDTLRANCVELLDGEWITQPDHLASTKVSTVLAATEPATALEDAASARTNALMVIGHHAHHRWSRTHTGGLATQLIHNAPVALIVTNDTTSADPLRGSLVLCVHHNTSPAHESVVFATRLALERELELHLLSVTEPLVAGPGRGYPREVYERDLASVHGANVAAMAELEAALLVRNPQLAVSSQVLQGYPTTELEAAISYINPSLTVIGSHHPSHLAAMFSNAVTRHLPAVLDMPVAVIPIS